ncbi:LLM class flavin-dependent oxidoreductase [Peribacillus cavernae]|uniref:LLM class flavin-dependent oxidoreductase n=1 Tax=Peribacillus cavernae TaxID=1674310 RepID=A0A3S0WA28_9BACI|nr:LLM class flavin-dependent oxidoreductase [Peribacillus cavernae]MDQ0220616.1 luciferase family oxidoreductase group 1 [Peribacillus cavernae]RUQ31082.1 LLM class flavin-dependent oxidoreductase [Peribacillus cavernae]
MKISILDQSPILSGATPEQALQESLRLAQAGEKAGYTRYWIAEHHDLTGLACPAPEVMLGYIGANTEKIRIGSGAVLLPHYKPYKVAETFNLLATLFPDRIDLGIGRAPGGSAEATMALSDNFLEGIKKMPGSFKELLHFLRQDFPAEHMFSKVSAAPRPPVSPEPWLLGTSEKSAILAAANGVAYAFGEFMSDEDGSKIVEKYSNDFQPSPESKLPKVMISVSVICAETTERAEELALSSQLWRIQQENGEGNKGVPSLQSAKQYSFSDKEKAMLNDSKKKMVIGNPAEVKQRLFELQELYHADEMMILTITPTYLDRIRSYQFIADEIL